MKRLLPILLLLGAAARAHAGGFEIEQFHSPLTSGGYVGEEGAFVLPHLSLRAAFGISYAHDPLLLRDGSEIASHGRLISQQIGMDVGLSFGLVDRLELAVALPFVPFQSVDNTRGLVAGGLPQAALGDFHLALKGLIASGHSGQHRLGFSALIGMTVPSSTGNYSGDSNVTGFARLIFEWRHPRVGLVVHFGAVVRGDRTLSTLLVGNQLSYGAAARVRLWRELEVQAGVSGLIGILLPTDFSFSSANAPAEFLGGFRYSTPIGLAISIAGGTGLVHGYGTPDGRAVFSLELSRPLRPSRKPRPTEEVPSPALKPASAAPVDSDSDGDGVVDRLDRCPVVFGVRENNGCPDLDRDNDGVVDRLDRCPTEPGLPKLNGCPPADRDQDGVPDDVDRCPDKKGSVANQGCPDFDSDGDGIIDRLDKCPFDPEIWNDVLDEDGCPDVGPALVELEDKHFNLLSPIEFLSDDSINGKSLRVLRVLARMLILHAELKKVRINAHTDNKGHALENLERSQRQASNVRSALIDRFGVESERLSAEGFGAERPIASNRTAEGRAKNRRIEVVVIQKSEPE